MKSSGIFRAIAAVLGSQPMPEITKRITVPMGNVMRYSHSKTYESRNGGKPSGAARLKRIAKKRNMAKARASKR